MIRATACAAAFLVGCGARSPLDVGSLETGGGPPSGCAPAPEPTALLTFGAELSGSSYSLFAGPDRLYTFVFGHPSNHSDLLSVDPCTGASVDLGTSVYDPSAAADGDFVYRVTYRGPRDHGPLVIARSSPLGAGGATVASVDEQLTGLTVRGDEAYAVDASFGLVAIDLNGGGTTTLVANPSHDQVGVWWDGVAVDEAYAYYYTTVGLEKVPVGGGARTVLFDNGGVTACGGSESAPDPLIALDDDYAYLTGRDGLHRVAKDGSSVMAYPGTENPNCRPLAVDDAFVYFGNSGGVHRVPKAGGAVVDLAPAEDVGGIALTDASVYWIDFTRKIGRVDKP
jgi:hypothetical protein